MSGPSINTGNTEGSSYNFDIGTSGVTPDNVAAYIAMSYMSTLSPSQAPANAGVGPVSSSPQLSAPDPGTFVLQAQQKYEDIVNTMLDNWSKALQDQADRIKEELASPSYRAWQDRNSTNAIAAEQQKNPDAAQVNTNMPSPQRNDYAEMEARQGLYSGLSNVLQAAVHNDEAIKPSMTAADRVSGTENPSSGPNSSNFSNVFIASSVAVGMGFYSNFQAPDVASTSQMEVNTMKDAWGAISPAQANDPATFIPGWFSAMWSIGLANQIVSQNAAEIGGGKEKSPAKDLEFAKQFAEDAIRTANGAQFGTMIMKLMTPMLEKAAEAKGQNPVELMAKAKITLLAVALALLYRTELKVGDKDGHMTGQEFMAMLSGEMVLDDAHGTKDLKNKLLSAIDAQLALLSPAEQSRVKTNLMAYFDSNPTVDNMLDPQSSLYSTAVLDVKQNKPLSA